MIVAAMAVSAILGLWAGMWLARTRPHHVARSVADTTVDAGSGAVAREIARARRYGRSFVVIRIAPAAGGPPDLGLLTSVQPLLRSLDHVWAEPSGIHVLLPEVGRDEGVACLDRLQTVLADDEVHDVNMAVFPTDAVTEGGLALRLAGRDDVLPSSVDLPGVGGDQVIDLTSSVADRSGARGVA